MKKTKDNQRQKHSFFQTWFAMPYQLRAIPIDDETSIRYPESLVRKFLQEYTREGDRILDPFAGFGTTLFVAQKMKRIGIGIEYDAKRYQYIACRLRSPGTILHGDALHCDTYAIAPCDFSMTSPPYMQFFHKENPLANYTKPGSYKKYLTDIRTVYARLKLLMKKDARVVVEVSNIFGDREPMTPLAWDIAREISHEFFFEREYIFCHKNGSLTANTGSHSYCLVFRKQ